jgi:hypothetical protein
MTGLRSGRARASTTRTTNRNRVSRQKGSAGAVRWEKRNGPGACGDDLRRVRRMLDSTEVEQPRDQSRARPGSGPGRSSSRAGWVPGNKHLRHRGSEDRLAGAIRAPGPRYDRSERARRDRPRGLSGQLVSPRDGCSRLVPPRAKEHSTPRAQAMSPRLNLPIASGTSASSRLVASTIRTEWVETGYHTKLKDGLRQTRESRFGFATQPIYQK